MTQRNSLLTPAPPEPPTPEPPEETKSLFISVDRSQREDIGVKWDAMVLERAAQSGNLIHKFNQFLAESVLTDPSTVFTAPDHPYSYTYVNMSRRHQAYRDLITMQGYRPVKAKDIEAYSVLGEEACLIGIERSPEIIAFYQKTKKVTVPSLPAKLRDKVGFILPPMVDGVTGELFYGFDETRRHLYRIPKEELQQIQAVAEFKANGSLNRKSSDANIEHDIQMGRKNVPESMLDSLFTKN